MIFFHSFPVELIFEPGVWTHELYGGVLDCSPINEAFKYSLDALLWVITRLILTRIKLFCVRLENNQMMSYIITSLKKIWLHHRNYSSKLNYKFQIAIKNIIIKNCNLQHKYKTNNEILQNQYMKSVGKI